MSDPNAQPPRPADEPPSQPFQPMSYDLAPEFAPPPAEPTSGSPSLPTSGSPSFPPGGPYGPPQSYPAQPYPAQSYPASSYPAESQPAQPYSAQSYPAESQPAPPYPAQSYPAQPYPAQPTPTFQPPVPPPPVGFPPATPPPARRKGRGLVITLSVLGGLLVLCGVLSCVFVYPVISESGATVSAPSELPGGLTKDDSEANQQTVDEVERQLKSDVGADQAVAGFYKDGDDHQVLVVAATTLILFPGTEVDNAFKGIREGSIQIDSVSDHDAGKLGGTVKCGTGKASDLAMTACVWADHGSAGIAFFFERGLSESADLFIQIREAVEKR